MEDEDELRAVIGAVDTDPTVVVCLVVPPELAAERVAEREPDSWPGKAALVARARILAEQIPRIQGLDFTISTVNRDATEVAAEVQKVLRAFGILSPQTIPHAGA